MGRREWDRPVAKAKREELPAGCMSGVLHFFDFHHILFTSSGGRRVPQGSSPQPHHCPSQLRGVEAPRNSLELDEGAAAAAAAAAAAMTAASAVADDDYFGVPIWIQVPSLTKKRISREDLLMLVEEERRMSSHCGTPRTPNVVARLMGLQILPDGTSTPTPGFRSQGHSPRFSAKKTAVSVDGPCKESTPPPQQPRRQPLQKIDTNVGRLSRSLPDTPRASSERSREGPRLSLQLINKENINRATHLCEASRSLPPSPVNSRSRRKDVFKTQSDESKSPRCHYSAREIVKQVKESIHRREIPDNGNNVDLLIKSRRTRPTDKRVIVNVEKPPPPARLFEPPKAHQVPPKPPRQQPPASVDPTKCKKASVERFTERIRRQPPPSETATQPSWPLKHRTLQPSSSSSNATAKFMLYGNTKEQDPEFLYVRSILERAGVMGTRPRWYSPSLPIDPFVFHQLELGLPATVQYNPGSLRHRCNRKLIFHLVEEILSDLIGGPASKAQRFHVTSEMGLVLEGVWSHIRGFPLANCQAMEDIEGLVAGDIAEAKVRRLLGHPLVEAEAEGIAVEIERDVIDSVIGEAAATLALCSKGCDSDVKGSGGRPYSLLRHGELRGLLLHCNGGR